MRDTGTENEKIGGQAERSDSREEMGVITEAMGIDPTQITSKTDSGAGRIGTEVG